MENLTLDVAIAGLLNAREHLPVPFQPHSHLAFERVSESKLEPVIRLADRLSAGQGGDSVDRARVTRQLLSIFSRVRLNSDIVSDKRYLPVAPLTLTRSAIFATHLAQENAVTDLYDALSNKKGENTAWTGLVEEAEALNAGQSQNLADKESYLESLLDLMQRSTACIPSAYSQAMPDVSLYDHSRNVAALAVCLAAHSPEQIGRWLNGDDQDDPVALLVGGDISGVQDFLYTLSSRRAAKTLRGRSFYLQLLTEAVARFVLQEMHLPYTNVIYSGGGHFYLLVPVASVSELRGIQAKVTDKLLRHHGVALYLAMGWAPVPVSGFEIGNFSTHWRRMHADLTRAKQQRYTELNTELYQRVFAPVAHGGNREKTCAICGEEREDTTGKDEKAICGLCRSFERFGRELAGAKFVALGLCAPQSKAQGEADAVLREFGVTVSFAGDVADEIPLAGEPQRAILWALDDPDDGQWPRVTSGVPTTKTLRYTVNRIPMIEDARAASEINARLGITDEDDEDYARPGLPRTFTHLQHEAEGIKRLGVLRMDVDDLGDIFGRGLVEKREDKTHNIATVSRVSALSFRMSLFFEGWVKRLCEQSDYANRIYPVYAGGDDLFLIGPWNLMPTLAKQIADDFADYVGRNPDIHLSAGMAFIHGKHPVYQAAADAKDELDKAKDPEIKNAFAFLGQAWRWDEFDAVMKMFERLTQLVKSKADEGSGGPRAILQALRQFARDEIKEARRTSRPVWGPWMWRAAYQFVRWEAQAGRDSDLGKALRGIHADLSQDDYKALPRWGAAARWAQLILREKDDGR